MQYEPKPARLSRAEQTQIVLGEHINGQGRLFGGRIMEWIDIVAAVSARRHCGCNVTTAAIDTLSFKAPAFVNDTIVLVALDDLGRPTKVPPLMPETEEERAEAEAGQRRTLLRKQRKKECF